MKELIVTGLSSFEGINVSSLGNFRSITVTQVLSVGGLNVGSTGTLRSAVVTEIASISDIEVSSGGTFRSAIVTEVTSLAKLNVSSDATIRNLIVTGTASIAALTTAFTDITVTGTLSVQNIHVNSIMGNDAWRGVAVVLSGTSMVTVSATGVASGYPILLTSQAIAFYNRMIFWAVNSIVDGVSFSIEADDNTVSDVTIGWMSIM